MVRFVLLSSTAKIVNYGPGSTSLPRSFRRHTASLPALVPPRSAPVAMAPTAHQEATVTITAAGTTEDRRRARMASTGRSLLVSVAVLLGSKPFVSGLLAPQDGRQTGREEAVGWGEYGY